MSRALFLLLLLVFTVTVCGRRGGGYGDGESERDDGGSSSDDSGTSTSSNDHCGPKSQSLESIDLLPGNVRNWTSFHAGGRRGRSPTTYGDSLFYGEAVTMHLNFSGDSRCHSNPDPVRLLGYAWVGPQPPYPEGPTSPFIVALNAWESGMPIEEIDQGDGLCPGFPELVKIVTTAGWADMDARQYRIRSLQRQRVEEIFFGGCSS